MQLTTEDFDQLTDLLPAQARDLARTALPAAQLDLSDEGLMLWVEGARMLLEAGSGMAPVVTYLRAAPGFARKYGESMLRQMLGVSLAILRHAEPATLDAFFATLATAEQRLASVNGMHGYLDLIEELSGLVPRALAPMLQHIGELLAQLTLDGLRRWALLGVQGHAAAPAEQDAWFRLDSQEARAMLRAAGEGALFTDIERRLGLYLRALWNREPELRPASAPRDGKKGRRVSIVESTIRMPQAFEVFPGQDGQTLYRAALAHAAAHLTYSTRKFPLRSLRPIQVALVGLIEDARVERLAMRELPGLARLWRPFHVAVPSFTMTGVSLMARLARGLIDAAYEDDNPFVVKGRELFAAAADRLHDPMSSREIGNLLGNDLGQMRVQFNFKSYLVEPVYRDDNLGLWDFGDAGQQQADDQEVMHQAANLTQQEGAEQTDAQLEQAGEQQAQDEAKVELTPPDAQDQAAIEEMRAQPYHYDEWDYLIQMDRPAWCTLFEKHAAPGDPRDIDEILKRNDEMVQRLTSMIRAVQIQRPKRLKKQLEGDRLDLDACIAASVDLRSGRTPDPRVHQRLGRNARDLAVLLLIDLSQSTNDFVPAAGTTVLDLARQATALVAHAMDQLNDDFAIHGFDSNGRHEVEYYRFKDFDAPYDSLARARLAGMRGQLSTRMGGALRHAGHFLRARRCAHKLILLLTDGEPHDIDVHDRQYLVFDSKRAVEDLRRHGVASFCLSLDRAADEYVTRIFGARNYLVLDHLRRLPERLPALYLRLTT